MQMIARHCTALSQPVRRCTCTLSRQRGGRQATPPAAASFATPLCTAKRRSLNPLVTWQATVQVQWTYCTYAVHSLRHYLHRNPSRGHQYESNRSQARNSQEAQLKHR